MVRMRFAAAYPRKNHLFVSLIQHRPIDSPRFSKIEKYGPNTFGYYLPIRNEADLDDQLQEWLRAAHRRGRQDNM
jgi:hypothetical protein